MSLAVDESVHRNIRFPRAYNELSGRIQKCSLEMIKLSSSPGGGKSGEAN